MFPIETTTLHPRKWPAALIAAIAIAVLFIPQKNNEQAALYIAIGVFIFSILFWFFLSNAKIVIDDSGLVYKTAFATREVFWNSVSKTYIKYRHHGKSGSYYWYFENSNGRKVRFSIKLYSRKDLRAIAEAVTVKCKEAEIEKRIYDMAEGQFPWYIWWYFPE